MKKYYTIIKRENITKKVNKQFNKSVIWNYVSIAIMAISGLTMNSVIALYYGSETLGIFSETYAWYLILSQLSVWGIHMAIVKFVPEKEDAFDKGSILKTGIIIVIVSSTAITIIAETIVLIMKDFAWKQPMQIALSGLILLSVNKVLLNYLNAITRMVAYAVFTSIRYGFLGALIFIMSIIKLDAEYLAFAFPVTEVVVFICLLIFFLLRNPISGEVAKALFSKMISFGTKLIPSYMVLEMNTKVDVVCLGALCADVSQIGIYSFAIFFSEGFYILYVTIRRIINPELARANVNNRLIEQIEKTKAGLKNYLTYGGAAAYIGISAGYILLCFLLDKGGYTEGVIYILIICLAILINGKYIIFGDLLAQTGYPLEESILNMVTVLFNCLLNILLILLCGPMGAAVATAMSHFVFSAYMRYRVKKQLGIVI